MDNATLAGLLARGRQSNGGGQQQSYLDSPMYQQMLAQTLAQGQPQSEYPGQAIANTASQLIQAYMLKQGMQQAQQKQQAGNQSLADALLPGQDVPGMAASAQIPGMTSDAPPAPAMPGGIAPRPITTPGGQVDVSTSGFKVDDPSNAGLVAALNGGAIDAQSLAPALMQKFGLGAPKEPMKFSPGDVGFDPVTHQAIPGMSAPFKPDAPAKPNYNQPFNIDGTPNKAFQDYEAAKRKADQAPQWANNGLARERLDLDEQKLKAGIPTDDAMHDMAVRYVNGDKTAFGSMGRNPMAQTAANNMISQVGRELGLKPEQISQNQQTFKAAGNTVDAFDRGKQGDTVRSLNVSVSHLETLRNLGAALKNGDVRLINAAKQKFAEQFGVPAPTNFDAAKSIVADEVAKGVIGGASAQSDRETLAASLRNSGGPDAINGAISTFQDLLGGQLRGLRQQYKSSTHRDDFNEKLFPDTLAVLDPPTQQPGAGSAPVHIGGDADYAKLPSGAVFIGPDGKQRKKP